jgi:hypothetical protein
MSELKKETSCQDAPGHIVIFKDGEWVDFQAERGRIVVFYCNLKFGTREGLGLHRTALAGCGRRSGREEEVDLANTSL